MASVIDPIRDSAGQRQQAIAETANVAMANRYTARQIMAEKARLLRQQADDLDALAKALPMEMPERADVVLFGLVVTKY